MSPIVFLCILFAFFPWKGVTVEQALIDALNERNMTKTLNTLDFYKKQLNNTIYTVFGMPEAGMSNDQSEFTISLSKFVVFRFINETKATRPQAYSAELLLSKIVPGSVGFIQLYARSKSAYLPPSGDATRNCSEDVSLPFGGNASESRGTSVEPNAPHSGLPSLNGTRVFVNSAEVNTILCFNNSCLYVLDRLLSDPKSKKLSELTADTADTDPVYQNNIFLQNYGRLANKTLFEGNGFNYTYFVPSNAAFDPLDHERNVTFNAASELLLPDLINCHVHRGFSYFTTALVNGDRFLSANGDKSIRIEKVWTKSNDTEIFVTCGHMKAKIVNSDIALENGVLHIIDGILDFPPQTVQVVLREHFGMFYDLIQNVSLDVVRTLHLNESVTILAPTDDFLNRTHLIDDLKHNASALREFIELHVIVSTSSLFTDDDQNTFHDNATYRTISNQSLIADISQRHQVSLSLESDSSRSVTIIAEKANLRGSNGVVHGVNGALIPSFYVNVMHTLRQSGIFGHFVEAVEAAGLAPWLEDRSTRKTVIAPTDAAVHCYGEDTWHLIVQKANETDGSNILRRIVKRHVIENATLQPLNGTMPSADGSILTMTKQGDILSVKTQLDDEEVGAKVSREIATPNGVVLLANALLLSQNYMKGIPSITTVPTTVSGATQPPGNSNGMGGETSKTETSFITNAMTNASDASNASQVSHAPSAPPASSPPLTATPTTTTAPKATTSPVTTSTAAGVHSTLLLLAIVQSVFQFLSFEQ